MDTEKYKRLTDDIFDLWACGFTHQNGRVEPYEPAEFQMAMTLALAMYLKAMFPHELEEVFRMHVESMRLTLEEVDAKSWHPEDQMSFHGIKF